MYYYLFLSNAIDPNIIKKYFDERGNWKEYFFKGKLDFLHLDTNIKYQHAKIEFKNFEKKIRSDVVFTSILDIKTRAFLTSKSQMHIFIKEKIPEIEKYVPKQYNFSKPEEIKNIFGKKIWIVKPSSGTYGEGIFITRDYKDFIEKLENKIVLRPVKNKVQKVFIKDKYVISEFIDNPLLIDGYSFSCRLHVLVSDKKAFVIKNTGWLAEPYKKFTLDTLDIEHHISNYKKIKNGKYIEQRERKLFPNYFETKFGKKITDIVLKQMYYIIKKTTESISLKCYEKNINCYNVWSYDFGVTKDYDVKLYEINGGSPDESFVGQTKEHSPKYFLDTLFDNIIDVNFPPKNKITKNPESYLVV
jgi:hypothetical protein